LVGENADEILDSYARAGAGDGGGVDLKRADLEGGGLAEVIHKQPGAVLSVAVIAAALVAGVVLWSVWPDDRAQTRESTALRPPAAGTARPIETAQAPRVVGAEPPRTAPEAPPPVAVVREPEVIPPSAPDPVAEERVFAERSAAPSDAAVVNVDIDPDGEELTTIVEDIAPVARVKRITPDGSDTLSFTFSGDCWVEVKNGEGENLYSDLSRTGDSLELIGEGPFRLRLGYAPGVELAFNRERVVLTPHTRNNIASLVLGQ
jgi:cytoskeleton protein RodZ